MNPRRLHCLFLLLTVASACAEPTPPPLPPLGASEEMLTVSGLSSGGYMAVQMQVAHSALVRGAGILAGGAYYCARNNVANTVNCMAPGSSSLYPPVPPVSRLIDEAEQQGHLGQIDPPTNLAQHKVWLLSGSGDQTVTTQAVDLLRNFYRRWVPESALVYAHVPTAGHALIQPDAPDANDCPVTASPYINRCGEFDAPGRLLAHLLGPLQPKNESPQGRIVPFSQHEFTGGTSDSRLSGLAKTGYVYVPPACEQGGCRVHVAFHGCQQQAERLGMVFVEESGYNRWADSNRLIVLYPQIATQSFWPSVFNPKACWDWWGYSGVDYHLRSGRQIAAVKAMIDRLTSPR
ncbi:extracellular catalytic domain type 2 short-chain-length polyhydroxyalkanoate depolymerase [Chitiniphilus shinanonensis]|uniref:extracellular catalytic domain type 2 short-chain-length polyhydroxyalkanoate depolymerase n=1 Tax=Chitiniphilus shinanonensis TaxID=553088 RepID=UPI003053C2FF